MSDRMYLLDNNALSMLGAKRRDTDFFRERCRVTEDVLYESRFTVKATTLTSFVVPVTPAMLRQVADIMKTVPVGDTKLVNLYDNNGTADPMLIAAALVLNSPENPTFFDDEWVIVTSDGEVATKAKEFGVTTLLPDAFIKIMEAT